MLLSPVLYFHCAWPFIPQKKNLILRPRYGSRGAQDRRYIISDHLSMRHRQAPRGTYECDFLHQLRMIASLAMCKVASISSSAISTSFLMTSITRSNFIVWRIVYRQYTIVDMSSRPRWNDGYIDCTWLLMHAETFLRQSQIAKPVFNWFFPLTPRFKPHWLTK